MLYYIFPGPLFSVRNRPFVFCRELWTDLCPSLPPIPTLKPHLQCDCLEMGPLGGERVK